MQQPGRKAGNGTIGANVHIIMMIAAIGYSLIYLLLGGGFGGAFLIFIVAKLFRK